LVTWTLVLLNVIIFVWDRQGSVFGQSVVFADLAMRPNQVFSVVRGSAGDSFPIITVFTSMFLHGSLLHLLGNMVYLFVFGGGVEDAMGPVRFTLYYLFWGVAAAFTQIFVDPNSMVPMLGASGAIGGVLGAFFLLFPSSKIEVVVPILLLVFEVSAWILLGLWFLMQIVFPQEAVANWAHAGGFLAGMVTVLVMGGRKAVVGDSKEQIELVYACGDSALGFSTRSHLVLDSPRAVSPALHLLDSSPSPGRIPKQGRGARCRVRRDRSACRRTVADHGPGAGKAQAAGP
jgi:membrane associated rhomboid family serine protease